MEEKKTNKQTSIRPLELAFVVSLSKKKNTLNKNKQHKKIGEHFIFSTISME